MKLHRGNFESNLLFLKKLPFLTRDKRILEIGSGMGIMSHHLRQDGYDVVGTETNAEYREFARKQYGLELVPLDGSRLPFPDQSFDIALSFDVFEHILDSDAHLAEVSRILKKDGYYAVATPNKWTNIPFEILKEKSFTAYKEYHVALHSYRELKVRFQKNGFRIAFVEVPLVTPFFIEKMRKYLGFLGVWLVRVLKPDAWPQALKTNFYVIGQKKNT